MKSYKTNPINSGATKILTTGIEGCLKISQELPKGLEQGNKMFQKFGETRLLKKMKVFIHYCLLFNVHYCWGEWPSGLRHCYQNRKVPSSNFKPH